MRLFDDENAPTSNGSDGAASSMGLGFAMPSGTSSASSSYDSRVGGQQTMRPQVVIPSMGDSDDEDLGNQTAKWHADSTDARDGMTSPTTLKAPSLPLSKAMAGSASTSPQVQPSPRMRRPSSPAPPLSPSLITPTESRFPVETQPPVSTSPSMPSFASPTDRMLSQSSNRNRANTAPSHDAANQSRSIAPPMAATSSAPVLVDHLPKAALFPSPPSASRPPVRRGRSGTGSSDAIAMPPPPPLNHARKVCTTSVCQTHADVDE